MQEGRYLLGSCVRIGGIPLDISIVHPIGKSFIMREREKRERENPLWTDKWLKGLGKFEGNVKKQAVGTWEIHGKNEGKLAPFRPFLAFQPLLRPSFLWNRVLDCPGGTSPVLLLVHEVQAGLQGGRL